MGASVKVYNELLENVHLLNVGILMSLRITILNNLINSMVHMVFFVLAVVFISYGSIFALFSRGLKLYFVLTYKRKF